MTDFSESRDIEECLTGKYLFGDDFGPDEIDQWYEDEREGYAGLSAVSRDSYRYGYHALNSLLGFGQIRLEAGSKALGVGAAFGDELEPVRTKLDSIVIVEPSEKFRSDVDSGGTHREYVRPNPDGRIDQPDEEFDLVTCFGTLHHIPNVSFVLRECGRVMKPGAYLLLREPIVSMGDWRSPRPGLTRRERGIPLALLRRFLEQSRLTIRNEALCMFPLSRLANRFTSSGPFNSPAYVRLDRLLCFLTSPNYRYHATGRLRKLRPTNVFVVAQKQRAIH